MRLLGKVALGGGLASAATATWLVMAGVLATSATLVALDPTAPSADAKALAPFDSCSSLLDWYVDAAVKDVGPYGWDNGYGYDYGMRREVMDGVVPLAGSATAPASGSAKAVSGSVTGTNTQEASVDEPDLAKTDGTLLARIADDKSLVLVDVSGKKARELGRLRLPRNGYGSELLLAGDHVLITQQVYDQVGAASDVAGKIGYRGTGRTLTRLLDIDISSPAAPRLHSQDRYTGQLLSARQYGGTVRLVTSTGRPQLDWTFPSEKVSDREAKRRNRALVRRTPISAWLPAVAHDNGPEVPVDCAAVLHPDRYAGAETLAVTTFAATDPATRSTVAVTAGGGIVYSSSDRLYVATTTYDISPLRDLVGRTTGSTKETTSLHAFDLTGDGTTYVGSGAVDGRLRDRWSLDEYDGHLRVAWTRTSEQGRTRNGITLLAERDGDLVATGTLGNLGIDEDIQSVRWFDDLAVLVTFRRTDPLYTVDLSDPGNPVLLGALKIPGFSGYLHPIGDDLLLGLGMSGDEDGLTGGAQAAVFDISNLAKPVQVSRESFRKDTYLPAVDDPRAFTWVGGSSTGVTPLSDWTNGSARMVALKVSATGKLTSRTVTGLRTDYQARSFALPDGRLAVLDGNRVLLLDG